MGCGQSTLKDTDPIANPMAPPPAPAPAQVQMASFPPKPARPIRPPVAPQHEEPAKEETKEEEKEAEAEAAPPAAEAHVHTDHAPTQSAPAVELPDNAVHTGAGEPPATPRSHGDGSDDDGEHIGWEQTAPSMVHRGTINEYTGDRVLEAVDETISKERIEEAERRNQVVVGILDKRGEGLLSRWQTRFVVLDKGKWSYYDSEKAYDEHETPKQGRTVVLRNYAVVRSKERDRRTFDLVPMPDADPAGVTKMKDKKTPRTFHLRAKNPREREEWIRVFEVEGCVSEEALEAKRKGGADSGAASGGGETPRAPPSGLRREPTPLPGETEAMARAAAEEGRSRVQEMDEVNEAEEEDDEEEEVEEEEEEREEPAEEPVAAQPPSAPPASEPAPVEEPEPQQQPEEPRPSEEEPVAHGEEESKGEDVEVDHHVEEEEEEEEEEVQPPAPPAAAPMNGGPHAGAGGPSGTEAQDQLAPLPRMNSRKMGYLSKKGGGGGLFRVQSWRKRFVVVEGGKMRYWVNEDDYDRGKPPLKQNIVDVSLYRVNPEPDPADPLLLVMEPLPGGPDRRWEMRADDENQRLEWIAEFERQGAKVAHRMAARAAAEVGAARQQAMGATADPGQVHPHM